MQSDRRRRRRGDGDRRTELVRAAAALIDREGLAAATTRRVAEEAGVPPGLVHYWFTDKDDLLQAVLADLLASLEAAVVSGPDVAGTAGCGADALQARLRAAFSVVEQDDPHRQLSTYELTTWALRRPETRHVARAQYASYRRLARAATDAWAEESGAEPPGGADTLAQLVSALFDGLTLAWLAAPEDVDVDGVLRLLGTLITRAAEASDAGPPPDPGAG